jgi:hypothetical protein
MHEITGSRTVTRHFVTRCHTTALHNTSHCQYWQMYFTYCTDLYRTPAATSQTCPLEPCTTLLPASTDKCTLHTVQICTELQRSLLKHILENSHTFVIALLVYCSCVLPGLLYSPPSGRKKNEKFVQCSWEYKIGCLAKQIYLAYGYLFSITAISVLKLFLKTCV